jgi:hypothetical protein
MFADLAPTLTCFAKKEIADRALELCHKSPDAQVQFPMAAILQAALTKAEEEIVPKEVRAKFSRRILYSPRQTFNLMAVHTKFKTQDDDLGASEVETSHDSKAID